MREIYQPNPYTILCDSFVGRAKEQGLKGKARDRAAIEFLCGGAVALHALARDTSLPLADRATIAADYNHVVQCTALLVCTRGYSEIEKEANRHSARMLKWREQEDVSNPRQQHIDENAPESIQHLL